MTRCNSDGAVSLLDHLLQYGIRDQANMSDCPSPEPRQIKRLELLSRPLNKGRPKKADIVAFYELLATPGVSTWAHSNKFDAIRVTGEFVMQELDGASILDIGCNIGYLTSWYARQMPSSELMGIDLSPSSIDSAKRQAQKLGIGNVRYAVVDGGRFTPDPLFDCIVDTQGMIDAQSGTATLARILSWLKPGGKLICVPAIGTLTQWSTFLDALTPLSCQITTFNWLSFLGRGERDAYPGIVIRQDGAEPGLSHEALIAEFQLGLLGLRQQRQHQRSDLVP